MPFIPKTFKESRRLASDKPYLAPNKLKPGNQVRFALLSAEPLCYFEVWGSDGENPKPFRFAEDPSEDDILAEMGPNFQRRLDDEGKPKDLVKFVMSAPIYNYENKRVETFSMSQMKVQDEFDNLSQLEEYQDLTAVDFILTRAMKNSFDMYGLRPVPRQPKSDKVISDAWNAALENGYDINRLLTGGHPHVRPKVTL